MNRNERRQLRAFVNEGTFNIALTLDFDHAYFHSITIDSMRKTLKQWDAAINRKLLGREWGSRQEEHIEYFAFIEKCRNVRPFGTLRVV